MKKTISFTTILHDKRKKLGLSLMEYCVADTIYNLSNNPKAPVPGWCIASKDTIALILDTTRVTIFSCVKKLIEINVVEKHTETKHLRTTQKWFSNIIIEEEDIEEEEEEKKPQKEVPPKYTEEDVKMTELLFALMKKNTPELKPKSQSIKLKSYEEMNRLHRLDKWSYEQIEFIIRFCQKNEFWKTNILSVQTLRKQFEKLVVKVKSEKRKIENEVMYAREDGTPFIKKFGQWKPKDNPNNIVDLEYYKSVAENNLLTKKEHEQQLREAITQRSRRLIF